MNAAAQIQTLVLARPDRIGDVVIASSCFDAVRRALPPAELHFLAQARMAPLFCRHPALASFIPIPEVPDEGLRAKLLAEELRRLNAQCIVHLHSDPAVEHAAFSAGISRRIGFHEPVPQWLTETCPNPKKLGAKHEGFYNFDLLKSLPVPAPEKLVPHLTPDPAARGRLAGKLPAGLAGKKYAVLHLGAHGSKPRITAEFFVAAAKWLVGEAGCQIVLIGDPRDDARAAQIQKSLGAAAASAHYLGSLADLAEIAWLVQGAALVFGRDSGPAHIAAAMAARTVTLMLEPEPENSSRRWQPLGEHSTVVEKPLRRRLLESRAAFARRNLRQYAPGEIVDALRRAWPAA